MAVTVGRRPVTQTFRLRPVIVKTPALTATVLVPWDLNGSQKLNLELVVAARLVSPPALVPPPPIYGS